MEANEVEAFVTRNDATHTNRDSILRPLFSPRSETETEMSRNGLLNERSGSTRTCVLGYVPEVSSEGIAQDSRIRSEGDTSLTSVAWSHHFLMIVRFPTSPGGKRDRPERRSIWNTTMQGDPGSNADDTTRPTESLEKLQEQVLAAAHQFADARVQLREAEIRCQSARTEHKLHEVRQHALIASVGSLASRNPRSEA